MTQITTSTNSRSRVSPLLCAAFSIAALSGCANQTPTTAAFNAIGQVVANSLTGGVTQPVGPSVISPASTQASPSQFKKFADTKLPGLLSNEPNTLNAREGYPKVALIPVYTPSFHNKAASTITYGAQGGCWIFKAKIWHSSKKSEDVPEFSYCMPSDIQQKARLGISKIELADVTTLKCIDSLMPPIFMDSRKNGYGPRASYRIVPEDYLNQVLHVAGSEQLYFMLRDLGLSPKGGRQAPCRAWVATSNWEARDF